MKRNGSGQRIVVYERTATKVQGVEPRDDADSSPLSANGGAKVVSRYMDAGVSGLVPFAQRPAGRQLLDDAAAGLFDEVWVTRVDRLGRDLTTVATVRDRLAELGVNIRCTMIQQQPR